MDEIGAGAAMLKVSHFGKMGDLCYALPVLRALHRLSGEKICLLTSGSCYQIAPLLWEQPYIGDVQLEDTKAHHTIPIDRGAIFEQWDWYQNREGLNLSLQPSFFLDTAPVSWTQCYMQAAGVTELTASDCLSLPSLVNHRRWMDGIDVELNGIKQPKPQTIILAPETDTLDELLPSVWQGLIEDVRARGLDPIIVGTRRIAPLTHCTDLRGLTSVPVLARLIAESRGFIGAHSFPWHLARLSETPAVCLQTWREGLRRCLPVDTKYQWLQPAQAAQALRFLLSPVTQVPA